MTSLSAVTPSDALAPSDTEEDFASASEGGASDTEEPEENQQTETTATPSATTTSLLPAPPAPPLSNSTAPEPEIKEKLQQQTPSVPNDPPKLSAADALSRIVSEDNEETSAGGWGGWGSWLSSTVKSVTQDPKLDTLLNKASTIGSNIRTVAARTVDNVYENLDPEYEREKQHVREAEGSKTGTGGPNSQQSTDATAQKDDEDMKAELDVATEMKKTASHAAENILQTIDMTFDFASNALGTAVLGGYRKLEQVKIKERLEHLQHDVTSSEVIHVGENVVSTGLGALEALGRKAIDILNEERSPLSAEAKAPTTGKGKGEPAKATLNGFFEDNCGNAHLQAMSMLSAECSLKVTSISSIVAGSPTAANTLKELEKIFDTDEILEEVEEVDESICASEAGMREMNLLLDQMGLKASSQLRQLQAIMRNLENVAETEAEQFQKDLASAIAAASATSAEDGKKKVCVKDVLDSSMLNTYTNGSRSLANFAEKSCEQILRISEAFLMRIAEDKVMYNSNEANHADTKSETAKETMSAKDYGTSLRKLTVQLLTETQYVSNLYIRCLAKLVETAKAKGTQDEKTCLVPLEKNQVEAIDGKLSELNNQLYTDAGQAMTFVQDAMHSNLSILKLMSLQQLANERDKKAAASE